MITVVTALILNPSKDKFLIVKRKKSESIHSSLWAFPGGIVEKNENILDALKREIMEELGLKLVSSKKIAETKGDVKEQITVWFDCKVANYDFKLNKKELSNGGFFSEKQMKNMKLWPATKEFFEKYVFNKTNPNSKA